MGVLNDYVCKAHGRFEAYAPTCPYGCSKRFVEIEFNQAPAIKSARTTNTDKSLRGLAADYGMTDMRNDPKSGESVKQTMRKGDDPYATMWKPVPQGRVSSTDFGVQPDSQGTMMAGRKIPTALRTDPRGKSDLS